MGNKPSIRKPRDLVAWKTETASAGVVEVEFSSDSDSDEDVLVHTVVLPTEYESECLGKTCDADLDLEAFSQTIQKCMREGVKSTKQTMQSVEQPVDQTIEQSAEQPVEQPVKHMSLQDFSQEEEVGFSYGTGPKNGMYDMVGVQPGMWRRKKTWGSWPHANASSSSSYDVSVLDRLTHV